MQDWRAGVVSDLAARPELSQPERTLLDVSAVDMALLAVADAWLRENADKVVNKRRRPFVPLVERRPAGRRISRTSYGARVEARARPKEMLTLARAS